MKKRKTYWFVEPLNSLTNEAIARELAKTSDISETIGLDVGDDSRHDVFQLPSYHLISLLYAGKVKFGFKFKIYRRQGRGQAREWLFGEKKPSFI